MNLSVIPRTILKHRRALLTAGSFIFSGFSFAHIWNSRHKIDAILDETRERRHSEDKQVRREARWETTKRLMPIVLLPAFGMIGSMAMGMAAYNIANGEIATAYNKVESMTRIAAQNSFRDDEGNIITVEELNRSQEQTMKQLGIPYDKYRLLLTGEVFSLPRTWRQYGIDDTNDEIERLVEESDDRVINLGQIRTAIKSSAKYSGLDDTVIWDCSHYGDTIPTISVTLPETDYNGELMWEIRINGFPSIDSDTAMCS